MSSISSNLFAHMFEKVCGATQITKVEANAKGLDTSDVEGNFIDAETAYADKDMQEYVIAQFNADMDELDDIPEEEEEIKPATGEGTQAGV